MPPPRARNHVLGPHQGQVAGEDRHRFTEVRRIPLQPAVPVPGLHRTVDGGGAAPGVRGIDDVIVDEGTGLDELQAGGGVEHGLQILGAALRPQTCGETGPGIERTDPLATVEHEAAEMLDRFGDRCADASDLRFAGLEEALQAVLDHPGDVLEGEIGGIECQGESFARVVPVVQRGRCPDPGPG